MPEPPGTPWVDEEYCSRYFTGGDNFFYSDEMPGGNALLGPVEDEEAPSPGVASSSSSESSDDSEPGIE